MPNNNAARKPVEPNFGPRIPLRPTQALDGALGWQEQALCASTDPEAFFPEGNGSTAEAKLVCKQCSVKSECLNYALTHDESSGIWGGLTERERSRLKERQIENMHLDYAIANNEKFGIFGAGARRENSQTNNRMTKNLEKRLNFFKLRYWKNSILLIRNLRSRDLVGKIPFDAFDYANWSEYKIASTNDALLIAIENSNELQAYPSINRRLSTLIRLESLTKVNKLQKTPIFPDWEHGLFSFIRDRHVEKFTSPREIQIFAEELFGLSISLHPGDGLFEYALVANVRPGNLSKGFSLVNSNQDSDLEISFSIVRALAKFLFSEVPISIVQFSEELVGDEQKIFEFITDNYLDIRPNVKAFKSKKVLSPFLEAAVLGSLEKEEIDIRVVAEELYEVSDIFALSDQLQKSGWMK